MDLRRLDSSEASAVAEGEAPPLQESGVVGLHLVESDLFLSEMASHLTALDLGSLILHLRGKNALEFDGELDMRSDEA